MKGHSTGATNPEYPTKHTSSGFSPKKPMHGQHGRTGHKVMTSNKGSSVYSGGLGGVKDPNVPHQNGKCG